MTRCRLRDVCGARSGDKGDISDITVFADDRATYDALVPQLTAERVTAHFGELVRGPVERYLVPNVLAVKFVLHGALGGGASTSLRSDSQGKTHGLSLLRLWVDLPDALVEHSRRRARPPRSPDAPRSASPTT
jgi:hypothetical protein